MSQQIVEQHIENKLRFYYFRNYRWILHSLYWLFVYVRGQFIVGEAVFSGEGFLLNFLFDNWIIIIFYYVYALYLVPKLFKRNQYKKFFTYFLITLAVLPLLNVAFQIIFEPLLPLKYQDHHFNWHSFFSEGIDYYILYIKNFVLFAAFLFLMETAESLSNFKAIEAANESVRDSQKQMLKTQVNPVFIMTALDNIQDLAAANNEATSAAIIHFSDVLRYRLYRSKTEKLGLAEELKQVKNTFELYNTAYNKNYILEVEGDTTALQILPTSILGLLAQLLDTIEKDVDDSLVLYLLAVEQGLDLAIEWESPVENKLETVKNMQQFVQGLYENECSFEFEMKQNLCSIRLHLDL